MEHIGGMLKRALTATAIIAIAPAFPVHAQDFSGAGAVRAGRELAITLCSECHVVVPRQFTRRRIGGPPDFVDIANEASTTAMALSAFLRSPHPTMPNLVLSDRQSNDAIAYILSLKRNNGH
jgi:mono/diheme cytochrome c family protein